MSTRPPKSHALQKKSITPTLCLSCVCLVSGGPEKMNPSENDRDRQGNGFTKCEEVLDAYLH